MPGAEHCLLIVKVVVVGNDNHFGRVGRILAFALLRVINLVDTVALGALDEGIEQILGEI